MAVPVMSSGLPKRFSGVCCDGLLIAPGNDHLCTVRHKTGRNRGTDAATRARHQYDLPGDAEQ
jgi:hypothetical protein